MSSLKKYLIFFTLYYLFYYASSLVNNQDKTKTPSFSLVERWEKIENGFPLEDVEDTFIGKRTQYMLNRNQKLAQFDLNIRNETLKILKGNIDYFKLSFKFWFKAGSSGNPGSVSTNHDKVSLSSQYELDYQKKWMPCFYTLTFDELALFRINVLIVDTIVAFKDFKIEYLVSQKSNNSFYEENHNSDDKKLNEFVKNNWTTYIHPKNGANEIYKFIYFPNNGDTEYKLDSTRLRLPKVKSNVNRTIIEFEYWIKGAGKIEFPDRTFPSKDNPIKTDWIASGEIKVDYKNIFFKVKATNDGKDFVAIRNLNVNVFFDNYDSYTFQCESYEECEWNGLTESSWTEWTNMLTPERYYYYPTSQKNSMTINRVNDDLMKNDVCYIIGLSATNTKSTKFNIYFKNSKDSMKILILTLKPKTFKIDSELEEYRICIRDFIALNIKNYSIIFDVEQPDMIGNVNDFLLSVKEDSKPKKWEFEKSTQNFLQNMKVPEIPQKMWNKEWTQISPISAKLFDLDKEDHVLFSGTPESDIPASAFLLSQKWIENREELRKENSRYSIESKNFGNFSIKPRICDWVSQCYDVNQVMMGNIDKTLKKRSYEFNYLNLDYSPYIKLLFYVEYFGTSNVQFELRLEHFGDPCSVPSKCNQCEDCVTNIFRLPNEPCPCDENEQCRMPINETVTMSREKYCLKENLKCEDMGESSFRCVCGKESLNWNNISRECEKPVITNSGWTEAQKNVIYNSTQNDNSLNVKFMNINTEKQDICMKLVIKLNQTSKLTVVYSEDIDSGEKLFEINLLKRTYHLKFCVRDFRYNYSSNFFLKYSLTSNEDKKYFDLRFDGIDVDPIKFKSLSYIEDWNHLKKQQQNWNFIPDKFTLHRTDKLEIDFEDEAGLEPSKALLISNWIESGANFGSNNYFKITYNKMIKEYFKMKSSVLIFNNDKTSELSVELKPEGNITENGENLIQTYRIILQPKDINGPFKIKLEITYSVIKPPQQIKLKFHGLSVGDPCILTDQKTFSTVPTCPGNSECVSSGPTFLKCRNCEPKKTGQKCELDDNCDSEYKKNVTRNQHCKSALTLPKENLCEMISPKDFRCMCSGNYIWDNTSKICKNEKIISSKTMECDAKKCFMESSTNEIIWSSKNLLFSEIIEKNIDVYRPKNNKSEIKIAILNLDQKSDACLRLSYSISPNAKLNIKINEIKSLTLKSTRKVLEYMTENFKFENDLFCVKNLYKKMDGNFNITLSPVFNEADDYSLLVKFNEINMISFQKSEQPSILPFLTHWNEKNIAQEIKRIANFNKSNQWTMFFPTDQNKQKNGESFWTFNDDDTIKFQVVEKNPVIRQAYLISNWLRKDISKREFKFQLTTDTGIYENFVLRGVLFDENMKEFSISDKIYGDKIIFTNALDDNKIIYHINESKVKDTPYRIGIKVDYIKPSFLSECSFTMTNLSFGDPCINDDLQYRLCNQKQIQPNENYNYSKCMRIDNFNYYKCDCSETEFEGKDCETKNYCELAKEFKNNTKTGNELCTKLTPNGISCNNTGDYRKIECFCNNGTYWNKDLENSNCLIVPKCVFHKCEEATEKCVEPTKPNEEPHCECDKNRMFYNSTKKDVKCEMVDVCSEEYRSDQGFNEIHICNKQAVYNATCIALGPGEDDYMCLCPKGFSNVKSNLKQCEFTACSFPSLNKCEQHCEQETQANDGYKCTCNDKYYETSADMKCVPKKDKCPCKGGLFCDGNSNNECNCKDGFIKKILNGTNEVECEPDVSFKTDVCRGGNLSISENKKELICLCGDRYQLNDKKTCDLKPICGKGGVGREDCAKKGALCFKDIKNEEKYSCVCPSDKQFNSDKTNCEDKCSLYNREYKCSKMNAICDPLEINEADNNNMSYCKCKPGFIRIADNCFLAKQTQEFSMKIKNTFMNLKHEKSKPNYIEPTRLEKLPVDAQKLVNDIQSMKTENLILEEKAEKLSIDLELRKFLETGIKNILSNIDEFNKGLSDSLVLESFTRNDDSYDCKFALTLDGTIENNNKFVKKFRDLCISTPETKNLCFFQTNKRKASHSYYTATVQPKQKDQNIWVDKKMLSEISLKKYEPCEKSRRAVTCPDYSICRSENGTSRFWCECNEEFFTVSNSMVIPLEPNQKDKTVKLTRDSCKLKDNLCDNKCTGKDVKCITTAPTQDEQGNWKAEPVCICNESNFRYLQTNRQCSAVCDNSKCKHGTCNPKGFACECSEGWSGENCDKEYSVSSGGWIAGIVVLAVLLVVASGIAFIFARRARNSGTTNSSHQMDDYTGSSYRVGQTGSAGARGQPAFQGRDNPSFHRD